MTAQRKKPDVAAPTEDERRRAKKIFECMEKLTGGCSVKTIENLCFCNEVQANAALRLLEHESKVEPFVGAGKSRLWRIKREQPAIKESMFS